MTPEQIAAVRLIELRVADLEIVHLQGHLVAVCNDPGVFVDPDRIAADHADGMSFAEIHAKAMAGGYAPEQDPVEIPEISP